MTTIDLPGLSKPKTNKRLIEFLGRLHVSKKCYHRINNHLKHFHSVRSASSCICTKNWCVFVQIIIDRHIKDIIGQHAVNLFCMLQSGKWTVQYHIFSQSITLQCPVYDKMHWEILCAWHSRGSWWHPYHCFCSFDDIRKHQNHGSNKQMRCWRTSLDIEEERLNRWRHSHMGRMVDSGMTVNQGLQNCS